MSKSDDKQKIEKKKADVCREFGLVNLDQTNLE